MITSSTLHIPSSLKARIFAHLFPGDHHEHELVILAGQAVVGNELRLLAREVVLAREHVDCGPGRYGHRTIKAQFIQPLIRRAREQRLVFLSVHNHGGEDEVGFSADDLQSHERGYPALLDLAGGMPVGAIVFARNAIAGDIWMPDGRRIEIEEGRVVGSSLRRLFSSPRVPSAHASPSEEHKRQVLMFGKEGQDRLRDAHVGIIGAGGVGSLLVEYLSRLGVGRLTIVDPDRIEPSNLSRVVGATRWDARLPFSSKTAPEWVQRIAKRLAARKVDVARRVARQANPRCEVEPIFDDFAKDEVARRFLSCDFLFLAADSMRARLVFNAIVQQYFVPGLQLGSRITSDPEASSIENAFSVLRWVLPQANCLWCSGMISTHQLATEAKSDAEALDQAYGTTVANPSVITMNAISASHAVNDFLLSFLGLYDSSLEPAPLRWKHLDRTVVTERYPGQPECSECGALDESRFGRGDAVPLPTVSR